MDNHPFWYIRNLLVDVDLYYSLRFGAGLKVLGWIELVENLKVLLDVNKRRHEADHSCGGKSRISKSC